MKSKTLTLLAGKNAWPRIKEEGLKPDMVHFVTAAAGGPKWLVLNHFDRMLFSSWFANRKTPLYLIGASSGAWRFAAVSQHHPVEAIERFQEAYIHQTYSEKPSPAEVTSTGRGILDQILQETGISQILNHPYLRLNVIATRSKWPTAYEHANLLKLGLLLPGISNVFSRKSLDLFFERVLFYHPNSPPALSNHHNFHVQCYPLSSNNTRPALLASGSIPMVMEGIKDISEAREGIYRDGGIIDYHMDLPLTQEDDIVLFPHYTDRIIPGWLDKCLPWRKPLNIDNTLLICPSHEFLAQLPYGKVSDRKDFIKLMGKDKERFTYWNEVVEKSQWLADEFWELVQTEKIKERIQPLAP